MDKPLIGVTAGEVFNRDRPWSPVTYGQTHTYTDAIIHAGGIPVIIPLTFDKSVLKSICEKLDGLLLSGGNDIHPQVYGQKPYDMLVDLSDLRDSTDTYVLEQALKRDLPILAICRGMQMLNVYYGGDLYQDIPTDLPDATDHESSTKAENTKHEAHNIAISPDSKLCAILRTTSITTNSHHHQAVKNLGKNLKVTAVAPDGIIEGLETDDNRFIVAVQSHPESLIHTQPEWQQLFKAFIDKSARKLVTA